MDEEEDECCSEIHPLSGKRFAVCYTRTQWVLLATCLLGNFGCAVCWSLQGPFYPEEAERKKIRPAVYGLVFGVFSLTEFLTAPLFGKYAAVIGPRFLANAGIVVTSTCCILFGFLSMVPEGLPFISLSFAIRIVEAMGDAAYNTGCVTLIAKEFSLHIGSTFAALRACYGVGLITGPSVGGVLFQLGGFTLPFAVMGGSLLAIAGVMKVVFYKQGEKTCHSSRSTLSIFRVLRIPSVLVSSLSISAASTSVGFLVATLEPHLRQFNLSPVNVGLCFIASGAGLALTAIIWGWLSDGKLHPKLLTSVGAFFMVIVYLLMGPAPFFKFDAKLWLVLLSLTIHGFCLGSEVVVPFGDALRECVRNGLPDNLETYGMIAGLWSSCFQFGQFIGPTIGGILLDISGFRDASMFVLTVQFIVFVLAGAFYCRDRINQSTQTIPGEATPLSESLDLSLSSGRSFTFGNIGSNSL